MRAAPPNLWTVMGVADGRIEGAMKVEKGINKNGPTRRRSRVEIRRVLSLPGCARAASPLGIRGRHAHHRAERARHECSLPNEDQEVESRTNAHLAAFDPSEDTRSAPRRQLGRPLNIVDPRVESVAERHIYSHVLAGVFIPVALWSDARNGRTFNRILEHAAGVAAPGGPALPSSFPRTREPRCGFDDVVDTARGGASPLANRQ
jgi:hypothetical protein